MYHRIIYTAAVLFFALVQARVELPQDVLDYIKDLHDTCIAKTGLTEEQHQGYEIGNKDPKVMCYMECMMLQGKWMSGDKTIQYGYIEDSSPPSVHDVLVAALAKCKDIAPGSQECEKAYNFNDCMFKADPENWYLL